MMTTSATVRRLYEAALPTEGGYRDIEPKLVEAIRSQTERQHGDDDDNNDNSAVRIVDVREPFELVSDLGHIPRIESVPLDTLDSAARSWKKDEIIILVCRSGGRSARAAKSLVSSGFRRVMNMSGGMLAWNAANLPLAHGAATRAASPT